MPLNTYDQISDWISNSPAQLWGDPNKTYCFYSGAINLFGHDLRNWQWAESWAGRWEAQTIGQTQAWSDLEKRINGAQKTNGISNEEVDKLQQEASVRYAQEAEGAIKVFALNANPGRVFMQHELPQLLTNEKVESLNGVPMDELRALYAQRLHAADSRDARERERAREAVWERIVNAQEEQRYVSVDRAMEQRLQDIEAMKLEVRRVEEKAQVSLAAARQELEAQPAARRNQRESAEVQLRKEEADARQLREQEEDERRKRLAKELEEMRQRMLRQQSEQQTAGHSQSHGHGY